MTQPDKQSLPEPPLRVLAKSQGRTLIQWWVLDLHEPLWISRAGAIAELHALEIVDHPMNDQAAIDLIKTGE